MGTAQQTEAGPPNPAPAPAGIFRRTVARYAVLVVVALLLAALHGADTNLSLFYLQRQDLPLLAVGVTLLALCCWRLTPLAAPFLAGWRLPLVVGGTLALAAYAGHYLLLGGYDLSRDEQMAVFDAAILSHGDLAAPLPALWQDHADALNTMFMHPAGQFGAWISAYLPLNAGLRSLVGLVADPALTGPLMTLVGLLALWGCARRIWPGNREAPVVALLLYAGSAQILFNGMTAYAMPAHLALNLCWLWLFLQRSVRGDVAALAIGFVAVGLHQPLMHPLVVGPILFLLLLDKSWWRAAAYALGYAAICLFWLWWPNFTWGLVAANALAERADGVDYFTRLAMTVLKGDGMRGANMMANMLRFFAWQHLLLLPLLLIGLRFVRRDRLAGALAAGVFLTIAVMTVILPYQGHGFGYRYLHGLVGHCILLAVYGWVSLGVEVGRWRTLLVRTSIAGFAILLPIQAWMAHGFYAAPAGVSARIAAIDADYVVVGGGDAPFAADLVINHPYLDARPIRLLREEIDAPLARALCSRHPGVSVALAGPALLAPIGDYFAFGADRSAGSANRAMAAQLGAAGCRVRLID